MAKKDRICTIVPKGKTYPSSSAHSLRRNELGFLEIVPESGGFVRRLKPETILLEFFRDWDVVDSENTVELVWRPALLLIDDETPLEGYLKGPEFGGNHRWNGWSCPLFTKEQVVKLQAFFRGWHEKEVIRWKDAQTVEVFDENEEDWYAVECRVFATDTEMLVGWDIGSHSWIWSECEPPERDGTPGYDHAAGYPN